jgi:23S rRNA U2552 (ribose-2'-O)-methylase RlmE/FtsJ
MKKMKESCKLDINQSVRENILSRQKLRENNVEGIDIMQISGHKNVAFINNYSTLSEERHKKISNILSNTKSETNRNAFQQTYLVKPQDIFWH